MLSITAHSASPRIINESSWLEKPRRESGAHSVSPRSSRTDSNVPGDCQDISTISYDAVSPMVHDQWDSSGESRCNIRRWLSLTMAEARRRFISALHRLRIVERYARTIAVDGITRRGPTRPSASTPLLVNPALPKHVGRRNHRKGSPLCWKSAVRGESHRERVSGHRLG